jgi:hypothetical protein
MFLLPDTNIHFIPVKSENIRYCIRGNVYGHEKWLRNMLTKSLGTEKLEIRYAMARSWTLLLSLTVMQYTELF